MRGSSFRLRVAAVICVGLIVFSISVGLPLSGLTQVGLPNFEPQFYVEVSNPIVDATSDLSLGVLQEDGQAYPMKIDLYFPSEWIANPSVPVLREELGEFIYAVAFGIDRSQSADRLVVRDHNDHADPNHPADGRYHWIAEDADGLQIAEGSVDQAGGRFHINVVLPAAIVLEGRTFGANPRSLRLNLKGGVANGALFRNPSQRGTYVFSARLESDVGQIVFRDWPVLLDGPPTNSWTGQVLASDPQGTLVRGLDPLATYLITASGEYNYDWRAQLAGSAARLADTECSIDLTDVVTEDPTRWRAHRWDTRLGRDVLDLVIIEQSTTRRFDWLPISPFASGALDGEPACSETHTYQTSIVPKSEDIALVIDDVNSADNSGALEVNIQRAP